MAFRIDDLTLQLILAGGQPGACTCGAASGAGAPPPPCGASNKPGGGKPTKPAGTPKKRALNALRAQLREMSAPQSM